MLIEATAGVPLVQVPPDGVEESVLVPALQMYAVPDIAVGDYTRKEPKEKNSLRSLIAPDIAAIESAQAKLAI